jgi:hypothetical protein
LVILKLIFPELKQNQNHMFPNDQNELKKKKLLEELEKVQKIKEEALAKAEEVIQKINEEALAKAKEAEISEDSIQFDILALPNIKVNNENFSEEQNNSIEIHSSSSDERYVGYKDLIFLKPSFLCYLKKTRTSDESCQENR